MELTAAQRRTLEELIRPGRAPPGPDAVEAIRGDLEAELQRVMTNVPGTGPLRLSKGRLSMHAACEGWFQADLAGEGEPFGHGPATAAGTLTHRAIQPDLVVALSFGVAPYRVATVFCESMEWQPEDVTADVLEREALRVIDAARSAALFLREARSPSLAPGHHCRWCPRALSCPASAAR